MRRLVNIWIVGLCLLVLVACGGESSPSGTPVPATPPPATATSVPEPEMAIEQIVWSQAIDPDTGAPSDPVTSFTTASPAIIAMVEVSNIPAGTEFTATWTINSQPVEGADMHIVAESDLPHAWVSFSYARESDQLYPVGIVGVVITSSEGDMREGAVEIVFP